MAHSFMLAGAGAQSGILECFDAALQSAEPAGPQHGKTSKHLLLLLLLKYGVYSQDMLHAGAAKTE